MANSDLYYIYIYISGSDHDVSTIYVLVNLM